MIWIKTKRVIAALVAVLVVFAIYWQIKSWFPQQSRILLGIETFVFAVLVLAAVTIYYLELDEQESEQRRKDAEEKAKKEPEKIEFAWDLARLKLEQYFRRNLGQVTLIFYLSVAVLFVGFGFILYGVTLSISKPEIIKVSYVSALGGVVTEFIGATFMLIYRSTVSQAASFMSVLERINTVGMAVQILESIPDAEGPLKNATRAEMVKLLLSPQPKAERTPTGAAPSTAAEASNPKEPRQGK